jgi:hypothetical protein
MAAPLAIAITYRELYSEPANNPFGLEEAGRDSGYVYEVCRETSGSLKADVLLQNILADCSRPIGGGWSICVGWNVQHRSTGSPAWGFDLPWGAWASSRPHEDLCFIGRCGRGRCGHGGLRLEATLHHSGCHCARVHRSDPTANGRGTIQADDRPIRGYHGQYTDRQVQYHGLHPIRDDGARPGLMDHSSSGLRVDCACVGG